LQINYRHINIKFIILVNIKYMGIILWIIFGGLVGWIASMLVGGSKGLLVDIIVGMLPCLEQLS
jgi:hypothetical protein